MNTQAEERRAENQAFQRIFEPKLIDPKLSSAGILTFSTSVVVTEYEAMVSSKEINAFEVVGFKVERTEICDNILEHTFRGKTVTDPVVMVRLLPYKGAKWTLWMDVDVSEYISAQQQSSLSFDHKPEEIQLAISPADVPPRNGEHGVNGNGGRLSRRQFVQRSLDALLVPLRKITSWPRNGHDTNAQQTTTPENERTDMKKKTPKGRKPTTTVVQATINGEDMTINPTNGAESYNVFITSDGGKVVGMIAGDFADPTQPEVIKGFLGKVQYQSPAHPSDKTKYGAKVHVYDAKSEVTESVELEVSGAEAKAAFDKTQAASATPTPPTAMAAALEAAPEALTTDATQPAPVATPVVCRFPDFDLVVEAVTGASKFTVELLMTGMVIATHTEQFASGAPATTVKDIYKKMKLLKGHPNKSVAYKIKVTALTDADVVVGTPATYPVNGSEILKAIDNGKVAAPKPDASSPAVPLVPKPTPTGSVRKSLPQAGIDNLNDRLGWIENHIGNLQGWWFAETSIEPKLKKVEDDILRLMGVYGNDESNLVGFMERANRANQALAEAKVKLKAPKTPVTPVVQPKAAAQTQVPPVVTQSTAQVVPPVQTPPPLAGPQPPTTATSVTPQGTPAGRWFKKWWKWLVIGCGALIVLMVMLVVLGVVSYLIYSKMAPKDDGLHRRPITPSTLVVPTNTVVTASPPAVSVSPAVSSAASGGVTTMIETREGGKVSTTVTNANGFIANAPFAGNSNSVTIIQVGGSWNGAGISSWPNNVQPTKTRKLELTHALLPDESEDFTVTINPNEDWEITYPSGPYWVELHVTSPSPNVFGGLISTPPSLYEATLDGNALEAFDGVRHYGQVLRLKSRGIKIVLGLRCTRK